MNTSLQELPIFNSHFSWFCQTPPPPTSREAKTFLLRRLVSNFGLDAAVVRRQVALFPSGWLCHSLKMRKEDNEASLHDD